jgi:hypothetical protein
MDRVDCHRKDEIKISLCQPGQLVAKKGIFFVQLSDSII